MMFFIVMPNDGRIMIERRIHRPSFLFFYSMTNE